VPVRYIPHPIRAIPIDGIVVLGRAYGVNYQNATLRPLMVIVTSQHTVGGAGQQARQMGAMDPPPGPAASAVAYGGYLNSPGAGVLHSQITFIVPAGWFYQIFSLVAGGGVNALNEWWEINL